MVTAFVGHDDFDLVQISAVTSKKESKLNRHYASLYQLQKFKIVDGKEVILSQKKKAISIVNFWASWCTPCVEEFGDLNKISQKYGKDIMILGVNTDSEDQMKLIKKFQKKYELAFPIVADKESKLVDAFIVDSIPFSVIYLNGKLHKFTVGIQDFSSGEYTELFDTAINNYKSNLKNKIPAKN